MLVSNNRIWSMNMYCICKHDNKQKYIYIKTYNYKNGQRIKIKKLRKEGTKLCLEKQGFLQLFLTKRNLLP